VENIRRVPGLAVTAGETMRVGYMLFDAAGRSGDGPLKDVRVRRAIAHAIDRAQFTKSFFGTEARVLAAPCFYTQFGCFQDAAKYEFDLAKAKQLMVEAGYPNGFDTELYLDDRFHETRTSAIVPLGDEYLQRQRLFKRDER
jgi:peptide/nickel transport system substrate-binding protein